MDVGRTVVGVDRVDATWFNFCCAVAPTHWEMQLLDESQGMI